MSQQLREKAMLDIKKKWHYEEITLPSGIAFREQLLMNRNGSQQIIIIWI